MRAGARSSGSQTLQSFAHSAGKPCAGVDGCEDAVFNQKVVDLVTRERILPGSVVTEDETAVIGLMIAPHAIFTDLSGQVIDGYRPFWDETPGCSNPTLSAWKGRYGLKVAPYELSGLYGGVLHSVGAAGPPTLATIDARPTTAVPGTEALGDLRWSWSWAQPSRLSSVAAEDGTDLVLYSEPSETVFDMGSVVTTGPSFLFNLVTSSGPIVAKSDGVSPPEPFAAAPSANAGFANSHVAWLKGVNEIEAYTFETVELWAVAYDPDLQTEKAYLVTDLKWRHFSGATAGWGHYVLPALDETLSQVTGIQVWNVATKTVKQYILPPERLRQQGSPYDVIGLTKEYAWVLGGSPIT